MTLPAELDFAADGLSDEEIDVLEWADSRLFSNENFLASKYGPDNWPKDVRLASVQAVPLLMLAIDVEEKADGQHVINWEVDSLDRILDDLGIYEGLCFPCYGNSYEGPFTAQYFRIIDDPAHFHREMLKTFAYLAKSDGQGILIRSFMENDADEFELLYNRKPNLRGSRLSSSFAWGYVSFMSQVKLPDGDHKSFPTMVYEIVGDAGSQREAVGRWFDYIDEVLYQHSGTNDDFADYYRPYSPTPYTPEPGYVLLVKRADRWISTGVTTSALRAMGLKAEQTTALGGSRSIGTVDIEEKTYYNDGLLPMYDTGYDICSYLVPTLEVFETRDSFDFLQQLDDLCEGSISSAIDLGYWPPPPKRESWVDRAALEALYRVAGGPDWKRNENWDSELSMLGWYGVVVNADSGRVTHLMLTSNGLSGELPPELGNLEELEELLLAGNPDLTGCVPAALRERLERHTGVEFCDPSQDQSVPQIVPDERGALVDREALVALHKATDGANWVNVAESRGWDPHLHPGDKNWLSDLPLEEWAGVTADETGRVVRLDLHWRELSGHIPPELAKLENLRVLDLRSNNLVGEIPQELTGLDNLRILGLSRNKLTGEIPPELGGLDKLKVLHLSGNDLTGEIPAELGDACELKELVLDFNELTGAIPPELGSLANLQSLRLQWNSLTGEIPPELGNLGRLKDLILRGNQLTGAIPPELGGLLGLTKELGRITGSPMSSSAAIFPSVYGLDLSNNLLTGSIPPELGNLVQLKGLNLFGNQLTGEIPPNLGNMLQLEELFLKGNQLTGELPPELGNMDQLRALNLSGNQLTGELPPELGDMDQLTGLNLSGNQLTGEIPPELGNLPGLLRLNLSHNELSGEIPSELGNLPAGLWGFSELLLNDNQLTGEIPPELSRLANLRNLHLQRNQLTGEIPPELSNLELLGELLLNDNKLTGKIPRELATLAEVSPGTAYAIAGLYWLDLSGNRLTGEIPSEFGELGKLRRLNLGDNDLAGAIPPELGDLTVLQRLDLTDNTLTGPIPPELGQLGGLTLLNLSGNQLTGFIPSELSNLGKLQNLSLSYNMLMGEIPAWLDNLNELAILNLSGNQLSGEIPSELGSLNRLRFLWIGGNNLTGCVPASITGKLQGPALDIPVCG